jgi:hypothetical protein
MDDVEDNLIVLSRRLLAGEELAEATLWLEDLDAPLLAERAFLKQHRVDRRAPIAAGPRSGSFCPGGMPPTGVR